MRLHTSSKSVVCLIRRNCDGNSSSEPTTHTTRVRRGMCRLSIYDFQKDYQESKLSGNFRNVFPNRFRYAYGVYCFVNRCLFELPLSTARQADRWCDVFPAPWRVSEHGNVEVSLPSDAGRISSLNGSFFFVPSMVHEVNRINDWYVSCWQ